MVGRALCVRSLRHSVYERHYCSLVGKRFGEQCTPTSVRRLVPLQQLRLPSPASQGIGYTNVTTTAQRRFQSDDGSSSGSNDNRPIASPIVRPRTSTTTIDDDELADSIRCCITGYGFEEDVQKYAKDTGMNVFFLGTSAGVPTKERSTSATVLRVGTSSLLFDAGEGIQRQLLFAKVNARSIDRIFITHLHGDHIFGLPGLLLGLHNFIVSSSSSSSSSEEIQSKNHTIKVYGPPGLYNYIASNIVLSCTKLRVMNIEIYELTGGQMKRTTRRGERNPFHQSLPEFQHPFLKRRILTPDKEGIWTIEDIPSRSREDILHTSKETMRMQHRRVSIKAAEVAHVPGVVTFGYSVEEEEPPRNIDPKRAMALGVEPASKKYDLLKFGFSVQSDDGSRTVQPEEVLIPKMKKARKFVLVGDNCGWTPGMINIAQNTDILVHEATLYEQDHERGHSTADMAGRIAGRVNARLLVLHHISARTQKAHQQEGGITLDDQIEQARLSVQSVQRNTTAESGDKNNNNTNVLAAYDFMEIVVPWMGFSASKVQEKEEEKKDKTQEARPSSSTTKVSDHLSQWFV